MPITRGVRRGRRCFHLLFPCRFGGGGRRGGGFSLWLFPCRGAHPRGRGHACCDALALLFRTKEHQEMRANLAVGLVLLIPFHFPARAYEPAPKVLDEIHE